MTIARATVSGVVVKAPEKRFTQNDLPIAGFTINIDKNTETLLRVVAYGQLAEMISSTVSQNDTVVVEGKLQINSFKLPNGKDKKVYEINASSVEKMSGSSQAPSYSQAPASAQSENIVSFAQDNQEDLIDEDEIPF